MDNYAVMQEVARKRFLTYESAIFCNKNGVSPFKNRIAVKFLGENAEISLETGMITFSGRTANFGESLCLYDWLCDGKATARPSGEFAPVSSLPGVMVRGNGLTIDTCALAQQATENPAAFEDACTSMGGKRLPMGDISYEIPLFADLTAVVKFYFPDEEFPANLTLLWDKNILQYIRYETVYYLAGCLLRRLERAMHDKISYIQPKGFV